MDKIKRFIECLIPVTACNIKCSYCYVIQENRRTEELPKFKYDANHIGKALSINRLGGVSYISICGAGETLIPKETIDITRSILEQGHYVNITTNGTLTKRFDEIITLPKEFLRRLHFSFSLHYLELTRINKLDEFFNNINKVKNAGCSILIQINLCDEYIPYLEEIKNLCIKKVGALPQVAATRDEEREETEIVLMTDKSVEEYKKIGESFKSPLFNFTMENFMKKRKEFCYAGDWTFTLDLSTGIMKKCYTSNDSQNIFENISEPIKFEAIGRECNSIYCINSSHFMSLGVIPSINTPTYSELRNRSEVNWYSDEMKYFLGSKLNESNNEYSYIKKFKISSSKKIIKVYKKIKNIYYDGKVFIYVNLLLKNRIINYSKSNFSKKIYFLMEPNHDNIGDQAISYAQKKFILDNFKDYKIYSISENEFNIYSKYLKKIIRGKDIICMIGGGNMGDEYIHHENTRRNIIKLFPNNKIISFPQTIYFTENGIGKMELAKSEKIYNKHKNLTVIARESISYRKMKTIFKDINVILTPDIVLYLDETKESVKRNGALLCFRNDEEGILSLADKEYILKLIKKIFKDVNNTDMRAGIEIDINTRDEFVKNKLNEFQKAELVITDRLHGMIFAAITSTPCIVFSNYNHKITGTYEWIKNLEYIKFAKDASEISEYIKELKKNNSYKYRNNNLKDYYNLIKDCFN